MVQFSIPFQLLEFSNILRCICYTHWNEPAVQIYNFMFFMIFRLTPVFCYWAILSSIFSRQDFLWKLFMKWCPVTAMSMDLERAHISVVNSSLFDCSWSEFCLHSSQLLCSQITTPLAYILNFVNHIFHIQSYYKSNRHFQRYVVSKPLA